MRFLLWALVALVGLVSPALADRKVALVVGNADYARVGRLANPVRDADAIAKLFTDAGFTSVRKVTDANLTTLREAMQAFEEEADGADVGVIFYSGHGIELGGTNYLIPTDAQLDKDRDVKWQTVPLDGMMETLVGVTKLKLVLLDACRDNPFINAMKRSGQTRSVSRGLARVDVGADSENTLIAYATAPGDLAQDGSGNNSPFTTALLKELTKPGVEIRAALGGVRDDVRDATQGRQIPFQTGSIGRELIYLSGAPIISANAVNVGHYATIVSEDGDARADFLIAMDVNSIGGWDSFLRKYPNGLYADLAREQREKLERKSETTDQQNVAIPSLSQPEGGGGNSANSVPAPSVIASASATAKPSGTNGAQAAQSAVKPVLSKAILYEEPVPGTPGTKLEGSVVWSFVNEPALPGGKPVPQIRGDVEVPSLGLKMRFAIHKNDDQALPASHIIEFTFDVPSSFAGQSIDSVPGMIAKRTEDARGDPITGAVAKVQDRLFWLALSGLDKDVSLNISLLKERSWFDIPIRYSSSRRAILSFEKGPSGETAFTGAFVAWGE